MMEWLEEQPDLDQPDIFRKLTVRLKKRHAKTGEKSWSKKTNTIEQGIEQFEEDIPRPKTGQSINPDGI